MSEPEKKPAATSGGLFGSAVTTGTDSNQKFGLFGAAKAPEVVKPQGSLFGGAPPANGGLFGGSNGGGVLFG